MGPKVRKFLFGTWKVGRVVAGAAGIYQIGVLHGIIMHATDPHEIEWQAAQQTISSVGGKRLLDRHEKEYKVSHSVANEVLDAARLHCKLKLLELMKIHEVLRSLEMKHGMAADQNQQTKDVGGVNVPTQMIKSSNEGRGIIASLFKGTGGGTASADRETGVTTLSDVAQLSFSIPKRLDMPANESEIHRFIKGMHLPDLFERGELVSLRNHLNEEVKFFSEAAKLLRGKWDVLVYDSPHPNAFVTPTVPRVIFISNSIFSEYKLSHDELGLILAHEVSHLLLQHTKANTEFQVYLDFAYIIALSLLPAELMVFGEGMKYVVNSLVARNSRDHESEADLMGIQIVSRGCFDIAKSCNALQKIAAMENKDKERTLSYTDTHPLSTDRFADLKAKAQEIKDLAVSHNPLPETQTRCSGTRAFLRSMWHR